MQNSIEIEQKHKKNTGNTGNNRYILIDLSYYNIPSIANVLFGYLVYCLFVQLGYGLESAIVMNAFKYLNRL